MAHPTPGSRSVRIAAIGLADAITAAHPDDPDGALADAVAHKDDRIWWDRMAQAADRSEAICHLLLSTDGPAIRQATLTCLADREAEPDPFASFQ